MSTIKIYTPSGEKIYFHDVDEAKGDQYGMIKITQKHREYSSEVWVMKENIICLQTFTTEMDALYFEPAPPEKEKPKDNNNWQTCSIISMAVSAVCLIAVIIMSLI